MTAVRQVKLIKLYLTHAFRYVKLCRKRGIHQKPASRRDATKILAHFVASLRDAVRCLYPFLQSFNLYEM